MRIGFVNQPFDKVRPPVQNSLGIWTYEVGRRMAASHEVLVYSAGGRYRWKELREDGLRYRRVPMAWDRRLMRRLGRRPCNGDPRRPQFASDLCHAGFARAVAKDLRRQRCDVAHVVNYSQFVPVIRRFNRKIKIALHMQCDWLSQLDAAMIEQRLEDVDLVFGCSEHVVNLVRDRFPRFADRCHAIRNGVDVKPLERAESTASNGSHEPRLMFLGRVSPEKGVHVMLDAFRVVHQRYPTARLDVVGPDGSVPYEYVVALSDDPLVKSLAQFYETDYRHTLDELLPKEVANRVSFTGNIPYSDVADRYRRADVFLFPSVWDEPFGMPNVEAMACGVPVVATRGGGIPEIIEHGRSGLLVARGSVTELAEAILALLDDESLRRSIGEAGWRRAKELFTWDGIANDLAARYE